MATVAGLFAAFADAATVEAAVFAATLDFSGVFAVVEALAAGAAGFLAGCAFGELSVETFVADLLVALFAATVVLTAGFLLDVCAGEELELFVLTFFLEDGIRFTPSAAQSTDGPRETFIFYRRALNFSHRNLAQAK
ncbi:MAG: hypothetical protein ACKOEW_08695 [Methylocystis sp.]